MENSFYHKLSNVLWRAIVLLLVVLAIYVSAGRMLAGNLENYRTWILQELNVRVPFTIEAQRVRGEWHSFTPIMVLSELRLSFPDSDLAPLQLSEGRVGIDVLNSLRTRSLQMTRIELTELALRGELTSQGRFRLTGFDSGGGEVGAWLREFLLNVEFVALRDNLLKLAMPGGEVRDLDLNLLLSRDGSHRKVDATLVTTRGTQIGILAEGLGDPFRPEQFTGELYIDAAATDLGAVKDMLAGGPPPIWAEGLVHLKLWVAWDKGTPSVEARVEAGDLLVTPREGDWQVPLEGLALQAHLQQQEGRWTLFASDVQLQNQGVALSLPRLQADVDGNSLRIRALDVPLEPLSGIITGLQAIPPKIDEIFTTLAPRGELDALQLSVADIENAGADWQLETRFEDIAVESYKGAPGITSGAGYARLGPGGGPVVLDSQRLTMDFPSIYSQPLYFDELFGTLFVHWDEQAVTLSSGLVTALGEEGRASVLFGMDIPLAPTEVGLQMDLLVGLENFHPMHRNKYVPTVLAPSLLDWLSDSIGEGRIEQGAFLWRGSLKKDLAAHRTVQLAFNVADTQLDYHPQWPPVTLERGVAYIDDAAVSVWADRARLLNSDVSNVSVETRLGDDAQLRLGVRAGMSGPAADGFTVLNESALSSIVGKAFTDWQVSGELDTTLDLQLNLSDKSALPAVEVATTWRDVQLLIMPGKLPVDDVNGQFFYSSSDGFSSRDLSARLWGEVVQTSLSQRHVGATYKPGSSVVEVDLDTQVDMADVRNWLQLEPLVFFSGEAVADVGLRIEPGSPMVLTVDSMLEGVSVDLPAPWRKPAEQARAAHIEMPLVEGQPIEMALGEDLKLLLAVGEGAFVGASMAVSGDPAPVAEGVFRVTGHAPLVEVDQWLEFVGKYFGVPLDTLQLTDSGGSGTDPAASAEPAAGPAPPRILLDQLRADSLQILGRKFDDVVFSLDLGQSRRELSLHTDWLRGTLSLARDGGSSVLDVTYLDLDQLNRLELPGDDSGEEREEEEDAELTVDAAQGSADRAATFELPEIDINLENLYQSERRLGNLAFVLQGRDGVFTAESITGELARVQMSEDSPGRLVWRRAEPEHTELQATLDFDDLGSTLEYFGYQRIVEARKGRLEIDLRWPDSPAEFSLLQGQGSVQVMLGKGSFLEAPTGATGALRVVSILNLADIVRRLSLTHMFESGIPFDSVDGEVYLHSGTIEVPRMNVEGGSSFKFAGVTEVASQSLTGELVATLPVASNLPWIAALAASLPVAAGVFVVSKVFDKQMNRLSSGVYSIGGTWNDPSVKFDRIFDDTSVDVMDMAPAARRETDQSGGP